MLKCKNNWYGSNFQRKFVKVKRYTENVFVKSTKSTRNRYANKTKKLVLLLQTTQFDESLQDHLVFTFFFLFRVQAIG